ncbi:MAG: aldehyde dehydrogenase family protein [Bacteroidales bacterium]|nr:aldehyde dehydrogenase family protein [Bacteroidales bacterium]
MIPHKIYAGGSFIESDTSVDILNPSDNQVFARVCQASPELLEKAIVAGLKAEKIMRELPVHVRSSVLNQLANGLRQNRDEFARLIAMESGKPMKYALGEVDRAAQTYQIASEECKRISGEYMRLDWTPSGEGKEAWIRRFPVGLIAGISPFNFPLNLTAHKIAPAIAAGNPIILKPASKTSVSILKFAELIDQTELPKGGVSILPLSRELGDQLVTDERIKLLSFTGSPEVGWAMKARSGKKKVLLELGGNAGVYVGKSAEVPNAVSRCVMGGFAFSGQVCIHVQRIYVEKSVFDQFISVFIKQTMNLKYGSSVDSETDISVMIDEGNAKRVEDWVNDAIDNGAKLLCGGVREGNYYPPTVLTNTRNEMKVCALEIFGPVVSIEPVNDLAEAIDLINETRYGLQAGVFTNEIDEMNLAFNNLEVGGVIINDVPTFRVDHMPYGGVKDSGLGREGVKYAIEEMTEPRLLVKPL